MSQKINSYTHVYRRRDNGQRVTTEGLTEQQANDRVRVLGGYSEPCFEMPAPVAVLWDELPLSDLPLVTPAPAAISPVAPAGGYSKEEARALKTAAGFGFDPAVRRMAELNQIHAKARLRGIVAREIYS